MPEAMDEKSPLLKSKQDKNQYSGHTSARSNNCKTLLSYITVEPCLMAYYLGFGFESVFLVNLWVDKVCSQKYSSEICQHLDSGKYEKEQDYVQRQVADYNVYNHFVEYLPATFIVLLMGAWSDCRDRKLPIILPGIGHFLKGLIMTANCYWWSLPASLILLAYVPDGLSGASSTLLMGAYSYVSEVSSGRSRTIRISTFALLYAITVPAGKALAKLVFDHLGYVGIFGIYSLFHFVGIIYGVVRLEKWPGNFRQRSGSVLQSLSFERLKYTVLVAFRARKNGKRGNIIGHLIVVYLLVTIMGLMNYNFLFCRKVFSWDYSTYTLWSIIDSPLSYAGTLLVLPALSYYWRVEDAMIGFVGAVSMLFCYIIRATPPYPWVFYLSSAVGLGAGMIITCSRAALSKLVYKDELGAVFAALGAGESLLPIASSSLFTAIYNATLDVFPGAIYAFAAGTSVVILFILTWLLTRRPSKGLYKEVESS